MIGVGRGWKEEMREERKDMASCSTWHQTIAVVKLT